MAGLSDARDARIQPLDRLLPGIRRQHPGDFYDAEGPTYGPSGDPHYHLKWMTPDGRVIWLTPMHACGGCCAPRRAATVSTIIAFRAAAAYGRPYMERVPVLRPRPYGPLPLRPGYGRTAPGRTQFRPPLPAMRALAPVSGGDWGGGRGNWPRRRSRRRPWRR
jgi:hypothetical protein